jgi:hypothetical protein
MHDQDILIDYVVKRTIMGASLRATATPSGSLTEHLTAYNVTTAYMINERNQSTHAHSSKQSVIRCGIAAYGESYIISCGPWAALSYILLFVKSSKQCA